MSQDLLSEFDSLYSAPAPAPPAAVSRPFAPSTASATSNRRFTSVDPWDPLNLNLPPAPRTQLPLHNVPLVRTAAHTHQHRASATNFDDLLGFVNSPQAPWPPRAPQVTRLGQVQRPVSFHGTLPSSRKIDPFAAMGNDFSGSDGRGGHFTPPPPRPSSRGDFGGLGGRRKSSTTSMGRPISVGAFGTTTPPPDLLGMGDDDDDDFGDFASAAAPSTGPDTTPPRNGFQQSGRSSTPPPPPTPPKPRYQHRHQKSLMDDDDFGEFMASPTTPPRSTFNTPIPRNTTASPPPSRFSTPPQTTNRHSISLRTFSPPKPKPTLSPQMPSVSVLLTAFPPLFLLPQTQLLNKLTPLPFPLRQRVLAHKTTKDFLEGVCELGRVAGRIIAGRKRRRAGPRNRNGGMALGGNAGWDQQKEEREVKETCRLWADGAGRLKAAMGKGVPEIVDEGARGGGAVGGCRLCALGEAEVVHTLKERTERSGWWDAAWGGHAGCRCFWEKHGDSLGTR